MPATTAPGPMRGPMTNRRVAVFARSPVLGQVKTRLAATRGDACALETHIELVERTLNALRGGAFDCELWFAGAENEALMAWQSTYGVPLIEQPALDLGGRMLTAIQAGAAAVVGTDIPALTARYVEDALDRLERTDVALGPTEDGGYCLIAMNEPHAELFRGIEWSTSRVFDQTIAKARFAGLGIETLETLWDVDDAEGYERWRALVRQDSGQR